MVISYGIFTARESECVTCFHHRYVESNESFEETSPDKDSSSQFFRISFHLYLKALVSRKALKALEILAKKKIIEEVFC